MSEYILETQGLTKKYFNKKVLDNVDLKIRRGDIYGFIGKNGAGKTTTIKLIAGLASPSSGEIKLFGSSKLSKGQKKIGTLIENPALYPYMSAKQNIEVQRILKGVKDTSITDELLEITGLKNTGSKKVKNFSLGMKQRLSIALSMVGDPEFLILDEPINGLDPSGIKEVRELILKLNQEAGITVLISSHILGELYKLATCYGVINKGVLVEQFTADEFNQKVRSSLNITVNDPAKAVSILQEKLNMVDFEIHQNSIKIFDLVDKSVEINSILEENEIIVQFLSKDKGDYENYFIKLMEGEPNNVQSTES